MSLNTHTAGGTNAGWRSPFHGQAMPWQCGCTRQLCTVDGCNPDRECRRSIATPCGVQTMRVTNPGYLARCPVCGARRPGA